MLRGKGEGGVDKGVQFSSLRTSGIIQQMWTAQESRGKSSWTGRDKERPRQAKPSQGRQSRERPARTTYYRTRESWYDDDDISKTMHAGVQPGMWGRCDGLSFVGSRSYLYFSLSYHSHTHQARDVTPHFHNAA